MLITMTWKCRGCGVLFTTQVTTGHGPEVFLSNKIAEQDLVTIHDCNDFTFGVADLTGAVT